MVGMAGAFDVEREVGRAIKNLLRMVYRLDRRHLSRASKSLRQLAMVSPHDAEIVDALTPEDALHVCAYLERSGLRAGRDYGVYRCGGRYGLAIKRRYAAKAHQILHNLQRMRVVRRIAINILKEWRWRFGKSEGDVYEALNLAYRVALARDKLLEGRCPLCGRRSGVMLKERIKVKTYIIFVC